LIAKCPTADWTHGIHVPEATWLKGEADNSVLRLKMCRALPPNCKSSFYSDKNRGNFTSITAVQFAALFGKLG
jgi:hypothetical protein